MPESPTTRSLKWWRKRGAIGGVVEKWNQYAKVRIDLFGFADVVVVDPQFGVIFLQVTSGTNHAKRRNKTLALENVQLIFKYCGDSAYVAVQSWRKNAAGRWKTRIELWDAYTNPSIPLEIRE